MFQNSQNINHTKKGLLQSKKSDGVATSILSIVDGKIPEGDGELIQVDIFS